MSRRAHDIAAATLNRARLMPPTWGLGSPTGPYFETWQRKASKSRCAITGFGAVDRPGQREDRITRRRRLKQAKRLARAKKVA